MGCDGVAFRTGDGGGDTVVGVLERMCYNAFKLKKVADSVLAGGRISDSDLKEYSEAGKKLAEAVK